MYCNLCTFTVPPPSLTITGSPRDTDFFQGLDLTLKCNIILHSAVDSPVALDSYWERNGTELTNSRAGRIIVTDVAASTVPSNYESILRFNPMDVNDTNTYSCTVTIRAQNETFITGTSGSTAINISDVSGENSC